MALGLVLALLMWTWVKGSRLLFEKTRKSHVALTGLVASLERRPPPRVPGTAVFLTTDAETAPSALLHNLKHNKVLHEKNVIVTVASADDPRVPDDQRAVVECLSPSFMRVRLTFGYMESPNVPRGLALARKLGLSFDIMSTSFFLSRRSLRPAAEPGMPLWQDHLFILLSQDRLGRHRLLPDPGRPGGRGRHPDHAVAAVAFRRPGQAATPRDPGPSSERGAACG